MAPCFPPHTHRTPAVPTNLLPKLLSGCREEVYEMYFLKHQIFCRCKFFM